MTDTKKEVINELYDATLLTTGVVGVSYLAKKVAGKSLGAPMTLAGETKLAVAVAGQSAGRFKKFYETYGRLSIPAETKNWKIIISRRSK